ncbi:aconitate hydratase AcnA [Starkeya sp. ORNL1]|uniref:aconitate hydratase AcnA n=1 Tax=Starkeya sp. ORNL1 TaxID=2709380 RepID=UPI0014632E49|nr:aconitate hydratase AcnA [Starkeya sp. ORNL1]QJP13523.1 aconitate hydratase AcnA [Starkeya sp. ORNL1]
MPWSDPADTGPAFLAFEGRRLRLAQLASVAGPRLPRLPHVLRILLENVVRRAEQQGLPLADEAAAILGWLTERTSNAEISFVPSRVLMHDTTCVPALVDIAAMRDAVAEAGGDPRRLSPMLPVDVSVDHSVGVDHYGVPDAFTHNMQREVERNGERYRFMKWASQALDGVRVHPPGTGIMHTINLEQLTSVAKVEVVDGIEWAIPDTLVGTDSHTPMVNALSVLAWGVGGLEAESVMLGMPIELRVPNVVGVRLTGRLREGVTATDLVLLVTHQLRKHGVSGEFVEYFGPGVSTLSVGERAVVANMAPEYGASSGFFPADERTIQYLAEIGRTPESIRLVEAYAKAQGLWFEPHAEPQFTSIVDIDLDTVSTSIAGPQRPQDRISPQQSAAVLKPMWPAGEAPAAMPRTPVAIAAITSCTNTTDVRLVVAAGLVARKARRLGLKPSAWVKTSLAPGSPTAETYLRRAGLLEDLEALGFGIVGYGCTTCIGNSGPLAPMMAEAMTREPVLPVAILSGNRNFPGRVHRQIEAGFLASPPLVVAYALLGDASLDILSDPLGVSVDGRPVRLADIWPSSAEIDAALALAREPTDIAIAYDKAEASPMWQAMEAPATPRFPWDEASTYLRRPPFAAARLPTRLGHYMADPLIVLGDDISTDHISPAGQIPRRGLAGKWLIAHGERADDLNVYAARRGNWQAMLRGAFTNSTVRNQLSDGIPPGDTVFAPTGEVLPLWVAAGRYAELGRSTIIVAGERYGAGSSRDWAAKCPALLGTRAVLALSFERIHRSNLIGMGILPLRLPAQFGPEKLALRPGDLVEVGAGADTLTARCTVPISVHRMSGAVERFEAVAAVETGLEVATLRAGGIIPMMIERALAGATPTNGHVEEPSP